jgi:hypothetical protein
MDDRPAGRDGRLPRAEAPTQRPNCPATADTEDGAQNLGKNDHEAALCLALGGVLAVVAVGLAGLVRLG